MNPDRATELLLVVAFGIYPFVLQADVSKPYYAVVCLLMLIAMLYAGPRGSANLTNISVAAPFYCLALVFAASSVWSLAPARTITRTLTLIPMGWLLFLAIGLLRRKRRRWVIDLSMFLTFSILASFLWLLVTVGTVRTSGTELVTEFGWYSNNASSVVVLCLPFLAHGYRHRLRDRRLLGLALACATIAVIISESRGALVMAVMFALLASVLYASNPWEAIKLLGRFAGGGALALGTWAIVTGPDGFLVVTVKRLASSLLVGNSTAAATGQLPTDYLRVIMIVVAARAVRTHPLLGIGYEAFPVYLQQVFGEAHVSHNLLITAWAECGIAGLVSIIWLAIASVHRLFVARRSEHATAEDSSFYSMGIASTMIVLMNSMLNPQLQNSMFYVVVAVALSSTAILSDLGMPPLARTSVRHIGVSP